jgi:urea carboxylase
VGETFLPSQARYAWCGDEFLFVEIDDSMSLEAHFIIGSLAAAISAEGTDGITDVCPVNASLMIRYDPDVVSPHELKPIVQRLENEVRVRASRTISARIFEVPVWYGDPITADVVQRFRDNHQSPDKTDLEFTAEVNGLPDVRSLITRHHSTPWMVTAVGLVAALPFMYQMVPRSLQLEAPKYLTPRTDTPALTVGHGGCFTVIYSVRGAGGYQMLGIAAGPVFAPNSRLADFQESMVLFRSGDIVKFTPIDEDHYEDIQMRCRAGTFRYKRREIEFDLTDWTRYPDGYNRAVMEVLDGVVD